MISQGVLLSSVSIWEKRKEATHSHTHAQIHARVHTRVTVIYANAKFKKYKSEIQLPYCFETDS